MYTDLEFVPVDREWTPTVKFVRELMAYLELDKTDLWCCSQPDYWDSPEDEPFLELADLPIEDALAQWQSSKALVTFFFMAESAWGFRVYDALSEDPRVDAPEGFAPWDVSIAIGPRSIPDYDQLETQAEFNFSVSAGGDGLPEDPDDYLEIAHENEDISSLLRYLADRSGIQWDLLMALSY